TTPFYLYSGPMRHAFRLSVLLALAWPSMAWADAIIKNPGDHPGYRFELEPHGIVGFANFGRPGGVPGIGIEGTVIVVDNGFIKTINNNVGIGFGANFFFDHDVVLAIPIVMQWNFFLESHWSVFGEPGVGLATGNTVVYPIFMAGGRYHFNERIALTLRAGYP